MSPEDVLGRTLETLEWLPPDSLEKLAAAEGSMLALINVASDGSTRIDANLIRTGDGIVVEFEKALAAKDALAMLAYQHPLMRIPDTPEDLKNYHDKLLTAIQAISGFRRCMIYRFMEDWDGEVIAEVAAPSDGSYLGLRFPASDIPAIARTLYLKNASRMIPDVNAEPVQVLGLQSEPPDLTFSDLRSVSPVHLEYLRNMGCTGTLNLAT